jgi:hypothetical protein
MVVLVWPQLACWQAVLLACEMHCASTTQRSARRQFGLYRCIYGCIWRGGANLYGLAISREQETIGHRVPVPQLGLH